MGLASFNEDAFTSVHLIFSLAAFLFAGISALASFRIVSGPFRYISLVFGGMMIVGVSILFGDHSSFTLATSFVFGLPAGLVENRRRPSIHMVRRLWGIPAGDDRRLHDEPWRPCAENQRRDTVLGNARRETHRSAHPRDATGSRSDRKTVAGKQMRQWPLKKLPDDEEE
jgi:hypothetical protein